MKNYYREINLEIGMPTVDIAERRLLKEIETAKIYKTGVMKIIHGYGSTGKGGKIKTRTIKVLREQKEKGKIKSFIKGEKFSLFDEESRNALLICPSLAKDNDLGNCNPGMTLVVFK